MPTIELKVVDYRTDSFDIVAASIYRSFDNTSNVSGVFSLHPTPSQPRVFNADTERNPYPRVGQIDQIDHDLDHLDSNLPPSYVVQDL